MIDRVNVLDHGFVELIDVMGDQFRVLESARVSTGAESVKGESKDRKLIDFLWNQGHSSPLESVSFTFRVKAPIFIARQWMRHRTGKYNEESGRYKVLDCEYYTPSRFMMQDTKNKQMSKGFLDGENALTAQSMYQYSIDTALAHYEELLELGVTREQARCVLPLALYTKFYFTMDLHNLIKFLSKRVAPDAQPEIQEYGKAMLSMIRKLKNFEYFDNIFDALLTE